MFSGSTRQKGKQTQISIWHAEELTKKITVGISALKRLRDFASRDVLVSGYNALIMLHFDYCRKVWDSLGVLVERL